MSAECLVIKKEPEDDVDDIAGDTKSDELNAPTQTEFVNIKIEIDQDDPSIRVKEEPQTIDDSMKIHNDPIENYHLDHSSRQEKNISNFKIPGDNDAMSAVKNYIWHPVDFDQMYQTQTDITVDASKAKTPKLKSKKEFPCTLCDKIYTTKSNLQRHVFTHSSGPFSCKHCQESFTTALQLQRHIKIHANYVCKDCGKVFKSSANLFQHTRTHLNVKPFKCPLCGKEFAVKANLKKHQGKRFCKSSGICGPITCDVCHKNFKTAFLLKSHLRRHTTEKPFKCDECNMVFKHKSTLLRHHQIHNGVQPFSCDICGKAFTHKSLLVPHIRIHTGEKPYTCPVCSKRFAHKHNMEKHKLIHNRQKKTVCEICNKVFPKESRLKYHMRTHVSIKYFKCLVCPKTFTHKQNIVRHYSRKHPDVSYECKDTDATVATKLWEDVINKKIALVDNTKKETTLVDNTKKETTYTEMEDSEEILPDLDRPKYKNNTKYETVKHIVEENKHVDSNKDGYLIEIPIKKEVFSDDSDDEILAKKIAKKSCIQNELSVSDNKNKVENETAVEACDDNTISNIKVEVEEENISDSVPMSVEIKIEPKTEFIYTD